MCQQKLKYSKEHEWLSRQRGGMALIPSWDHRSTRKSRGDMVFVDLPEVGATVSAGDRCRERLRRHPISMHR